MALQKGDKSPLVKKWQQFLIDQLFLSGTADGDFGNKTKAATIAFQSFYGLGADGIAGSVTLGKAYELGFNPDKEPAPSKILKEKDLMYWIKTNLGALIRDAIVGTVYTEDWLAGICARETGYKIIQYFNQGYSFESICANMKGDWSKRSNDAEKKYHGFGFWQIDIDSYPTFVNSGDWADPAKCCKMAVAVLNEKRNYLISKHYDQQLDPVMFQRAITASYNCGQGNVAKAINNGRDIDYYTFAKDYSREVFRYRDIYKSLA